jgi:hypothetical protein
VASLAVLTCLNNHLLFQDLARQLLMMTGDVVHSAASKLPYNIHGHKIFVVKLQNLAAEGALAALSRPPQDAVKEGDPVMLYDQAKSLVAHVEAGQAGQHAELLRILRDVGRPGRDRPTTRVAYANAKREGAKLRVFVGAGSLPEQEEIWS